ncbi:MAG: HAD hydrolase-like protein [Firmicutes bacterium]|nr:HAD hydrolase-like protein [Bacillota bacterium]
MAANCIFFDLDGTLTDSGEGIIHCASLTLEHFGLPVPEASAMRVFVGPPLRETFPKFGVPAHKVEEAVRIYREYYVPMGMFENRPYPGIAELLKKLRRDGFRLFVATSKPETMAVTILEKFGMAAFFERICGSTCDGTRDGKDQVIACLLESVGDPGEIVMVGDTVFDVTGAARHGIPTVGVSWGYGDTAEMVSAGAAAIVRTMDELYAYLIG